MNSLEDRPSTLPWPPLLFLGAIAGAVLLGLYYPLPWPGRPIADLLFAIGVLSIAAFVTIDFLAMRALRSAKTPILPTRGANVLVTSGPFAFSRNPIYLGNALLMAGLGLIFGNGWFLLLMVVACLLTQKLAIEPEEKHLALRFGKKYRDYQKKARRWF